MLTTNIEIYERLACKLPKEDKAFLEGMRCVLNTVDGIKNNLSLEECMDDTSKTLLKIKIELAESVLEDVSERISLDIEEAMVAFVEEKGLMLDEDGNILDADGNIITSHTEVFDD